MNIAPNAIVRNHQIPNSLRLPRAMARSAITIVKLLENRQIELKTGTCKTSRRRRAAETLPRVIQVGNHKDAEDGRFRDDQAPHTHPTAQFGRERHFRLRSAQRIERPNQDSPLFVLPVRIFRML